MSQQELSSSSSFEAREGVSVPVVSPYAEARLPAVPTREGDVFECLTQAERKIFVAQRDVLPTELAAFLTPWTLEQYNESGVQLFLHRSLRAGYGILNGELISVFSLPGAGLGRDVVLDAVGRGATHLDCLIPHEKLKRLYEGCGFVEVGRVPWDDGYAPAGWNYKRFGTPDLIFMRVEGR